VRGLPARRPCRGRETENAVTEPDFLYKKAENSENIWKFREIPVA
jgi:hypothetical protein